MNRFIYDVEFFEKNIFLESKQRICVRMPKNNLFYFLRIFA